MRILRDSFRMPSGYSHVIQETKDICHHHDDDKPDVMFKSILIKT